MANVRFGLTHVSLNLYAFYIFFRAGRHSSCPHRCTTVDDRNAKVMFLVFFPYNERKVVVISKAMPLEIDVAKKGVRGN